MARRIYSIGTRTFEIQLTERPAQPYSSWIIECVQETSDGAPDIAIPGLEDVVSAAEDVAFARACDRIDKWLLSNR